MFTTDFGETPRPAPCGSDPLGTRQLDLVRGRRRRSRYRTTEGAMLDHRIAGRVLQVVVGAEPEVVVLLLSRGIDPPSLVTGEWALLVVGRHDVLPQLGADRFDQVPSVSEDGKIAAQCVLPLKEVTQADSRHRRSSSGGDRPSDPAHAVRVPARPRPETRPHTRMHRITLAWSTRRTQTLGPVRRGDHSPHPFSVVANSRRQVLRPVYAGRMRSMSPTPVPQDLAGRRLVRR